MSDRRDQLHTEINALDALIKRLDSSSEPGATILLDAATQARATRQATLALFDAGDTHDPSRESRDASIAARVAMNDAAFRDANEGIAEAARRIDTSDVDLLPFICECADVSCTQLVRLSDSEYEIIRGNPRQFLNARGHEVNGLGWASVVDEFDRYTVVQKIGAAGTIAEELNPRGGV